MDQKPNIKVVQPNALKLFARSYQNPKVGNKFIVQLMKNFKNLYFHCDATDDVSIFTHNTQRHPEIMGESTAQIVNLT